MSGLSAEIREGLMTTVIDAVPDVRYAYPAPEIWPFVAALAVGAVADLVDLVGAGLAWGLIPPAIAFIAWYWPQQEGGDRGAELEKEP